jgi:hypothetical protein
MPINPESIRHPAHPVAKTYVPPGGVAHTVVTGESWTTLAQSVQMSPWDLIRYNYPGLPPDPQAAAREVNWYLQEYVGCTQLTQNRRNYEFHTGDTPGKIWLPSAPVPPSPDEAARKAVLAALRDPAVARMGFGVGFVLIFPRDYERVARAIESGAITVHADPSLGPHQANYNYQSNCFNVPPGISDLPLLIHEATHAIFDIRRIATGTGESEGMAYIAQALFSRVKYGPPRTLHSVHGPDPHQLVRLADDLR